VALNFRRKQQGWRNWIRLILMSGAGKKLEVVKMNPFPSSHDVNEEVSVAARRSE